MTKTLLKNNDSIRGDSSTETVMPDSESGVLSDLNNTNDKGKDKSEAHHSLKLLKETLLYPYTIMCKFVSACVVRFKRKSLKGKLLSIFKLIIFLVSLYFLLMPFLPELLFQFKHGFRPHYPEITGDFAVQKSNTDGDVFKEDFIPEGNFILIPAVGISAPVVEGSDDTALSKGAWRRPLTGTPSQGGNTVITGHRFQYLPPNNLTFYHLDKVKIKDRVIVYWDSIRYEYEVTDIFVVAPNQVEIEENTIEPQITLYTCTPLWTAKNRLVVIAKPVVDVNKGVELEQIDI